MLFQFVSPDFHLIEQSLLSLLISLHILDPSIPCLIIKVSCIKAMHVPVCGDSTCSGTFFPQVPKSLDVELHSHRLKLSQEDFALLLVLNS